MGGCNRYRSGSTSLELSIKRRVRPKRGMGPPPSLVLSSPSDETLQPLPPPLRPVFTHPSPSARPPFLVSQIGSSSPHKRPLCCPSSHVSTYEYGQHILFSEETHTHLAGLQPMPLPTPPAFSCCASYFTHRNAIATPRRNSYRQETILNRQQNTRQTRGGNSPSLRAHRGGQTPPPSPPPKYRPQSRFVATLLQP